MVAEMVYYFLLPEVEKQTTRDKGEQDMIAYNFFLVSGGKDECS